ncbi:hypothetical protein BAU15_01180 [Enterococcus sp. JM4C]|uniref:ASCH domain-containing protein n=1 Tax=Candidatus Enterococcus huntleyi TaxID=1857217 RepID=UPI00137B4936|nr:ASCH domain-containing protein [Enterococcus sp. JM4C]KAF1299287.1 hypothetical protein BAU15_01180 [Enterococcus sp. JM4C]
MQQVKFGGTAGEQDGLAELVKNGQKVATSTLKFFQDEGIIEPTYAGDQWLIVNSLDEPICEVVVTEVRYRPFGEIDETFAIEEGDGTFENWHQIHRAYYGQLLAEYGQELTEETILECIYFEKVS